MTGEILLPDNNLSDNRPIPKTLDRRSVSPLPKVTTAVQSVLSHKLEDENIHFKPNDYVAWQKDNKVCFWDVLQTVSLLTGTETVS